MKYTELEQAALNEIKDTDLFKGDIYTNMAGVIFNISTDEVTKEQRYATKVVTFYDLYGSNTSLNKKKGL